MTRRHLPIRTYVLLTAAVLTCLGAAIGTPAPQQAGQGQEGRRGPTEMIQGKWRADVAGRQYTLDLRVDEGDLVGMVALPNGKTVKVENGICVSDEFSFTTIEGEVEWEWNGTISDSGLEGERERFDIDTTEAFTAKPL